MSKISVEIFPDAEKWLKENLGDLTIDNVACVVPNKPLNKQGFYPEYIDNEENKTKAATMADHVKALQLLCEQIGVKLFVGGLKSPLQLLDAGNWDAEVADAFFQFVMLGEVIYG